MGKGRDSDGKEERRMGEGRGQGIRRGEKRQGKSYRKKKYWGGKRIGKRDGEKEIEKSLAIKG